MSSNEAKPPLSNVSSPALPAPQQGFHLMQCGDVAQAICGTAHFGLEADHPSCVVHAVSRAACTPSTITPNLEGRRARCGCGSTQPSSLSLAFFEFLGEGSPDSYRSCGNCGYYETAHSPDVKNRNVCKGFTPRGSQEFDRYYCGCRGWD